MVTSELVLTGGVDTVLASVVAPGVVVSGPAVDIVLLSLGAAEDVVTPPGAIGEEVA